MPPFSPAADPAGLYIQEIGALLFGMVFLFLYRQSRVVYFGLWAAAWVLRILAALFGYELLQTGHPGWLAPYATFEFAFVIVLIAAARAGFGSSMRDWRYPSRTPAGAGSSGPPRWPPSSPAPRCGL